MSKDPVPFELTPQDVEPLAEAAPEEVRRAQAERLLQAWKTPIGWRYWSAVNNSQVGLWYTAMTFFFLLFGGVLALLMRIQLAVTTPSSPPNSTTKPSRCMAR
jgi:cytochrome c oxidase subunit I+III